MISPSGRQLVADFICDAPRGWATLGTETAALSLCDTLAVTFAARKTPVVGKVSGFLSARFSPKLPAAVWSSEERAWSEDAALLNGVAAHALDYDDVATAWRGHPSAVMFAALAAVSSASDAPDDNILEAFVVGFEVGAAIGRGMIEWHYAKGWHSTSTIGVVAATAACCRYLKLSREITANALGLAVAQAGGTRANFGSEAKPLHVGFAAAGAVRATLVAIAGVESGDNSLSGPHGFDKLYGGVDSSIFHELSLLGNNAQPAAIGGIEIKVFPTCFATHRALSAAAQMRRTRNLSTDKITRVTVVGNPTSHAPLGNTFPQSADEAKFHMATCVAMMLANGSVGLADFETERYVAPDVVKLANLTSVHEAEFASPERISCLTVVIDDQEFKQEVASLPSIGWETAAWRNKVSDCLTGLRPGERRHCLALAKSYAGTKFEENVLSVFGSV